MAQNTLILSIRRCIIMYRRICCGKIKHQIRCHFHIIKFLSSQQYLTNLIDHLLLSFRLHGKLRIRRARSGILIISRIKHVTLGIHDHNIFRGLITDCRCNGPRQICRTVLVKLLFQIQYDPSMCFFLRCKKRTVILRNIKLHMSTLNSLEFCKHILFQIFLQIDHIFLLFIRLRSGESSISNVFDSVARRLNIIRAEKQIRISKLLFKHLYHETVIRNRELHVLPFQQVSYFSSLLRGLTLPQKNIFRLCQHHRHNGQNDHSKSDNDQSLLFRREPVPPF